MLRQALVSKIVVRGGSTKRLMMAAAATSSQKRALNKKQLEGSSDSAAPPPPAAAPPPPPSAPSPAATSGGGGRNVALIGLGLAAATGGAAYYFNTMESKSPSPSLPPVATREARVGEDKAPSTAVVVAKEEDTTPVKAEEEAVEVTKAPPTAATPAPAGAQQHRVSTIEVPAKMKNTASAATAVPPAAPHPEQGNRVTMISKKSKAAPKASDIQDTSMTEKALAELRTQQTEQAAQALLESHQSVWGTMDAQYFSDLDTLNSSQLKARIVQLATEMKDRTKWEAVRLKEFLAMKEKETADKYMEVMQKQRLEFEDLMARRLREQESDASNRMLKALQEKEATIQNVINTALEAQKAEHDADMRTFEEVTAAEIKSKLEDEYAAKLLKFKEEAAQDMERKVATLKALTEKLSQLEAALEATQSNKEGSLRAHRLSAAALALAEKLETNKSAEKELEALKAAAGPDGVIATALATIPGNAKDGVPTLSDLQARFDAVHKKCRQAALVPAGRPGLEGQLAGMVFAAVKYPPHPDDPAPEADKDNAEYVLVRAQKYVHLGQLERAVEQLEKLNGQPAFTAADWKEDAMRRIAVEKALKVIKMECALLNESLVE